MEQVCKYVYSSLFYYFHLPEASNGSDYIGVSMNLVFSTGSSNGALQCINVTIIDSPTIEEDETFTVILTTSAVVALGNDVITITIIEFNCMLCIHEVITIS